MKFKYYNIQYSFSLLRYIKLFSKVIKSWFYTLICHHYSDHPVFWIRLTPSPSTSKLTYPQDNYFLDTFSKLDSVVYEINPSFYYRNPRWRNAVSVYDYLGLFRSLFYAACSLDDLKLYGALQISQSFPTLQAHIFCFENTFYESNICFKLKTTSITTIGYLHSIPSDFSSFIPTSLAYAPDILLSSSRMSTNTLLRLGYPGKIVNTYNIRQRFSPPANNCTHNHRNILVLFSIDYASSLSLLEFVQTLSQLLPDLNFYLKFHPWCDLSRYTTTLESNCIVSHDLKSMFLKCSFSVYNRFSTTVYESCVYNHSIIRVNDPTLSTCSVNDIDQIVVDNVEEFISCVRDESQYSSFYNKPRFNSELSYYLFNADIPQNHLLDTLSRAIVHT